jgi:hypothetical protein
MKSEYHIHLAKYLNYEDEATKWYIKSMKFKCKSDEWTICILKERIYRKQAMKHLIESQKYQYGQL